MDRLDIVAQWRRDIAIADNDGDAAALQHLLGHAWDNRHFSCSTSKSAGGQSRSSPRNASSSSWETARRAYHLRSAGTTCQGATSVLVLSRIVWYASWYCGHSRRSSIVPVPSLSG